MSWRRSGSIVWPAAPTAANVVEVPTAHGFCVYLRRDCLRQVGLLREDLFAQGYGEENDFCIRARHLGWRHVAVPGVFVAHAGAGSFGGAKAQLLERNLAILNRLHPGYDALIAAFRDADPLARGTLPDGCAALAPGSLAQGRGAADHPRARRRGEAACGRALPEIAASGLRPIVLSPEGRAGRTGAGCLTDPARTFRICVSTPRRAWPNSLPSCVRTGRCASNCTTSSAMIPRCSGSPMRWTCRTTWWCTTMRGYARASP